ncbi:tetratricopeptide repeat protein [Mucilaginibacter sp. 21P]|uniref:tetratricopeptide repeat protein n=1 Tax=Mucilaginibacter sp. 21P TaxID=2778902 RepID=UPI001C591666|nr:tetratricopeptide repeat protein [Mucilaginibacter sp. 21P]QXV64876.1 tetratricopeptide repeat protein [Mucilaginibacter sp. 21P]
MKYITGLSLLLCLNLSASAQSITKVDDALLLDYYQNQRFAEAADYLKQSYGEPVQSVRALGQLAYTSNMAGRLADAEKYYQRIYDIDSTNTGVLISLGNINLRRGNNTKAEIYYKRIVARDTSNFMAYKQLAKLSGDRNDIPGQIAYLQRANLLNPTEPDVASDLTDLYISLKLLAQAEKVLTKAISDDPENIILMNSLLKLQYNQKKWPDVIALANKLIGSGDSSGPVLSKLGVAYYNTKNYECALSALLSIDKISQNESSYYFTALAYKAVKDQPMAIKFLDLALQDGITPNAGAYYGEIADSNEKLKHYKKAVLAYQKSLQFAEEPMIYYSLANVYDTYLKDKKSAVKYYRKYLAGKPPIAKQQAYIDYSKSRIATLGQ